MRIGIAGAGGIGSNVAVNLVRSGITAFKIIDFDRIESSNLDRQFYFADQVGKLKVDMLRHNLKRINPDVVIETAVERITPTNIDQLFIHCDTIVEGLDKQADKKLVIEHCGQSKRLVVSASGIAGSDIATIQTKKIGNTHVIGDFNTDCCDAPLYAHKVITVAARMTAVLLSSCKRK